jgi:replication factor A1
MENAVKLETIGVNSKEINTVVKVVEKKNEKDVVSRMDGSTHRVAEFLVGDETGCIVMSLWDDAINQIEAGKTYDVANARVTVFETSMRLNPGKYGKITPAAAEIETVNTENNLSDRHVERPPRPFGGRGGGRFGGRRFESPGSRGMRQQL